MLARASLVFLVFAALAGCGGSSGGGTMGRGGGSGATGVTGAGGSVAGSGAGGAAGTGGGTAGSGGGSAGSGGGSAGSGGGAEGTGGVTGGDAGGGTDAQMDGGDGAAGDGGVCSAAELPAARLAPDILLLLDASGSMNNDQLDQTCNGGCGANSKWALTTAAVNQVMLMTDANVNWGLKFFSEGASSCTVSSGATVPVGSMNAAAIAPMITGRTDATGGLANGGGRTPTRSAETAAAAYLSALTDSNPRFILLATDGQPNCAAGTSGLNDDSAAAIQAVDDARMAGVPTFVVGIGSVLTSADSTLTTMATVGGYPRSASPAYYPVSSTAELVTALNQIVGIARPCRFAVAPPPGFSRDAIQVTGEGTSIPHDPGHANGWDYTDAGHASLDLFGAACTAVTSGTVARVSVVYLCLPTG